MKTNLRYHQRIPAAFEARIINKQHTECFGTIANISRAGLLVYCDQKALEDLHPKSTPVSPREPLEVDIEFNLPLSVYHQVALHAYCNIVHVRRAARDRYDIGMEFCHFSNDGFRYIDQYIAGHLNNTL